MNQPSTIQLKDYPRFVEELAFGNLFCTMNGWEIVDVEFRLDGIFALVTLWHYGREFKLLMKSTEQIKCTWIGCYTVQFNKPMD